LIGLFLDEETDLSVDAVHCDLVIFDNAFGVLDPQRFDAVASWQA